MNKHKDWFTRAYLAWSITKVSGSFNLLTSQNFVNIPLTSSLTVFVYFLQERRDFNNTKNTKRSMLHIAFLEVSKRVYVWYERYETLSVIECDQTVPLYQVVTLWVESEAENRSQCVQIEKSFVHYVFFLLQGNE